MILHDTLLLSQIIKLAREVFIDTNLLHAQVIAGQAMRNNWPDFIIAACWLHEIRNIDRQDALTLVEQVEEFSSEAASVLTTLSKKENESEQQYYKRVSESPFARAVLWLDTLDRLTFEVDHETIQKMLMWLPSLYPSDVILKYHFDMSK